MVNKLLVTGPEISKEAENLLKENNFKIFYVPPYSSSKLMEDIAKKEQIDAILVRFGEINNNLLKASTKLKVIAKHGTGVNNIDVKSATELNIPVFIAIKGNYRSVAEHTVALLFGLTKDLVRLDGRLRKGNWDKSIYKGNEIYGKSLGLIGLGRIARQVIELILPLNMNIIGYDPFVSENILPNNVTVARNLEEVLISADYISIHCPLAKETENLIGEKEFRKMKNSVIIINTARGGIIDESALVKALKNEWIAAAGLDTFSIEPPLKNNPLWQFSNVIVTPHIGGVTKESFRRMGVESAKHIISIIRNDKIIRSACINPQVLKFKEE